MYLYISTYKIVVPIAAKPVYKALPTPAIQALQFVALAAVLPVVTAEHTVYLLVERRD